MASSVRRPGVKPRPPMCFKFILYPRAHRLKVPKEFITSYGLVLPNPVFLRAPRGPAFQVEVINSDGEIWLEKGWNEFKEYYSIDFGHFLVFKYDGKSNFHVLIFDKTSREIEYPLDSESESDDDFAEDSDEDDPTNDNVSDQNLDKKRKRGERICVDKGTSLTYQRAKAFKSDNPIKKPYFISLIRLSYLSASFLVIPPWVVRENFVDKVNDIKLRVCNGEMWCVKCYCEGNARLGVGWNQFVKENKLKLGDALLFEVNKINKFVWNVFIFRS